ncbi:TetR/AcrR family transcriptional regulator [Treponema brennaborense]|uniref:Transcriptional regulator, TetR family n=1 Tax=Treponema brennaborense (strain DSM 12168 / CIP 105900 / DD5/3) TaxID=906968 RepID=F4LJY4_TREBD|nr:TetR/AcrR family transcriptional regulator [Treponema brennaborense]AEE16464.1 transcriptional regulator, TetR family [Treponema brennaborense DSM 12168]
MTDKADKTRQRILENAKTEFLGKGFSGASLRTIAKNAGVTTGALYGLFSSKDDLFEALVGEHASFFLKEFSEAQDTFASLAPGVQVDTMHANSNSVLEKLLDYMFDHITAFRLLLSCSAGSRYELWLERLITIEEESAKNFMAVLKSQGRQTENLSDEIIHMLSGSFLHGVMENVVHEMPRTRAVENIRMLQKYATAGWNALLGLD